MSATQRLLKYRLPLDAIRDWFLQIWFCHHNARVIADFESRMSMVLCDATGGRVSKPYGDLETMRAEISNYQDERYRKAYDEGLHDAQDEREEWDAWTDRHEP